MSVDRNDPCPCGSGKKYKKCCLTRDESGVRPAPREPRAAARDRAMKALDQWASRAEQRAARHEALAAFCCGAPPEAVVGDADSDRLFAYFCFDHPFEGQSAAETFLKAAGRRLDAEERRALDRLAAASLRVYQVAEVVPEEGLYLHDLWSSERLFVSERLATRQLHRWDILAARVTRFEEGRRELDGGLYLFPPELKAELLGVLKRAERALRRARSDFSDDLFWRLTSPLIHGFWIDRVVHRPRPKVVTAEGDPMEFGSAVFDVLDETRLRAALDAHPDLRGVDQDVWPWAEETGDFTRSLGHFRIEGDRLVLEVTSRTRAERGRRLVQRAAGTAVRHRSTRYESVEKALARRHATEPDDEAAAVGDPAALPPEAVAEAIATFKDQHYRKWPDMPIPALGGRTPRHAARLKTVRPKLVDLLTEMENHEARGARRDSPPYDFSWLWGELGLERQP